MTERTRQCAFYTVNKIRKHFPGAAAKVANRLRSRHPG
jgi:hypothetical protein